MGAATLERQGIGGAHLRGEWLAGAYPRGRSAAATVRFWYAPPDTLQRVTDDEPTNEADPTLPTSRAQVFVLRVWREAGDGAAPLRLRIVPAANDAIPRYFSSWRALAEWCERDGRQSSSVEDHSTSQPQKE